MVFRKDLRNVALAGGGGSFVFAAADAVKDALDCWGCEEPGDGGSAKAVRRVFYRILIFYVSYSICSVCHHLTASQILGTIVTGMLVPYTDPDLLQGLSFAQSP